MAIAGVRLISLQVGPAAAEAASAPFAVESLGEEFDCGPDCFLDTAAAMASLDLVVSCDTSVAHLAGALARPVWLALKYDAEWRWLRGRDDSPWYPSARLFRQTKAGEWRGVFAAMASALRDGNRAARYLMESSAAPSPLMGEGWGGGENHRASRVLLPPTLTLPHKGGGERKARCNMIEERSNHESHNICRKARRARPA